MERVRRNDSDRARTCALGNAANRYFQLSFKDLPDLFLRMGMLVNRCSGVELVMAEGHVGRIEIAASPARQAFDRWQFIGINECHVHPGLLISEFYASLRKAVTRFPESGLAANISRD